MNSRRADAGRARLRRETPRWERVPCCGGVRDPPTPGGPPKPAAQSPRQGAGWWAPTEGEPTKHQAGARNGQGQGTGVQSWARCPAPHLSPQSSCSGGSENRGRSHLTARSAPFPHKRCVRTNVPRLRTESSSHARVRGQKSLQLGVKGTEVSPACQGRCSHATPRGRQGSRWRQGLSRGAAPTVGMGHGVGVWGSVVCGNPESSQILLKGQEGSKVSPWTVTRRPAGVQAWPLRHTQAPPRAECMKRVICLPNGHVASGVTIPAHVPRLTAESHD